MQTHRLFLRNLLLGGGFVLAAFGTGALAADVTPDRLVNADKEPQNWLMNHRTYDGQRFSPLDKINKAQRQGPQARLCGRARRRRRPTKPGGDAARRGRLPLRRRSMGRALQDRRPLGRRRAASCGAWTPGRKSASWRNRGAALWGNLVVTVAELSRRASSPPTRRPARSCGKPISPTASPMCSSRRRRWPSRTRSSSAPPAATAACATGSAALDAATGKVLWRKFTIPAPGEPGSETWKDKNNAWQTGGGAMWVTGTYDRRHQPDHLGHRQSGADVRPDLPSRRQPLHQQRRSPGTPTPAR